MNLFKRFLGTAGGWMPTLAVSFLVGCGGGNSVDPILGTPGTGAVPRVIATSPLASTPVVTGVAANSRVSAAFSEPMSAATLTPSSFSLSCPGGVPVVASVAYDVATRVATLTPAKALPASTLCVATLTTAVQDTMGFALASNFVWSFVTAPAGDVTAPTVVITMPAAGATNVPSNMQIAAVFSEDMNPASLTAASFTLVNTTLGSPVPGSVSYSAANRTAIFTPTTPVVLAANSLFTATITTVAADLAGNRLATNFAWTFTTAAAPDTTRPTIVLTVPAAGATGVPNNTAITATFSEDMNPASISAASFTLFNSTLGRAVPGIVTYSATSRTAMFAPSTPGTLASNSQFSATLTTAAADMAGNSLAANVVWTFTTAATADTTRPTVVLTVPAAGAVAVSTNTAVTATFSEDMNPASISGSSFTLVNSTLGSPVTGIVTYSAASRTAVFTPSTPATLAPNSQFTATLTGAVTDLAGNALAANAVWTFGTAAAPDTTRPTVVLTVPSAGATAVAVNTAITATFSEAMNPASLGAASFTVDNTTLGTAVPGVVTYSATSRTAIFTASAPGSLAPNSQFTARITTAATDLAGNALAATFVWSFSTAAGPDTTRPTVVLTVPAAAASGVPLNTAISASFSEDMNPATLSAASFTLVNTTLGTPVAGIVTYSPTSRTAIFTPSTPGTLPINSQFSATITTAATDLAGNAMAANFVWTFSTAVAPDTTRPTVVLTVPAAGASAVALNTAITATFSEDMNPESISGSSFTLFNTTLGSAVAGVVTYSPTSRTAIFTPSTPGTLPTNSQFRATVTTAATDLAGNALATNYVWTFSTSAAPDTNRPIVVLTVPEAGATAVPLNTAITATFSEAMNPDTISTSSFTLVNNTLGSSVAGTVTYSTTSRTAIFTPNAPGTLAINSQFTATITPAATDLAGNHLAASYVWTFSTAEAPDTTRPTVVLTVPAAGASAVPVNTAITATFSEDMNPATLSGTSFTLVNTTLGSPVSGVVTYSAISRTAIFTPNAPGTLATNSQFTATVTSAATDVAGNALAGNTAVVPNAGNHVWTFATVTQGDGAAPTITLVSPPDGGVAICRTRPVSATFSEPMDADTISGLTFSVTDAGVPVAGNVGYNATTQVASFVPTAASGFSASRTFVVTVKSGVAGVKDLSGNPLSVDRVWRFTTGSQACLGAINLGSAASFGSFGGDAGVTNQGVNTVVAGNLGSTSVCTGITGFHDGANAFTETPLNVGAVNGSVYCAPDNALPIATRARADAQAAYNTLAALPAGSDPGAGELGGLVLPAGVYTAAGGAFRVTSGNLTLDGQGDANATWVFQTAAALTVGQPALPRRVLLINGAQARNVFWQVGSAARIEDRSVMVGTLITRAGVTISTAGQTAQTVLTGRALGLNASVTMVNTTIVAP